MASTETTVWKEEQRKTIQQVMRYFLDLDNPRPSGLNARTIFNFTGNVYHLRQIDFQIDMHKSHKK